MGETTKVMIERKCDSGSSSHLLATTNCDKALSRRQKRIHLVTKPSDVWIHRDGRIHEATFFDPQKSSDRTCNGKINNYLTKSIFCTTIRMVR